MKRWLIAAALLTIAVSVLVFTQALSSPPSLHFGIPGQWTWRYDHSPYADRALICLVGAALLGWMCFSTRERILELTAGRLAGFLTATVMLCFWLQASFAYLSSSGFGQAVFWTGTPKVNPDFVEACKATALRELLAEAQNPNRPFRIHLSTHPPDPVIFYLIQKRLWEAAPSAAMHFAWFAENTLPYAAESRKILEETVLARSFNEFERATLYSSMFLIWLVVALGVVPLYFWTLDLYGPRTAVVAVSFYPLIPSLVVFNPVTDQLYVPLALSVLAMLHLGLARRDMGQLIFAGILTWLALQFTLAFLVVLFLFAVYVGLEIRAEGRVWETLKLLGWSVAAFVVMFLIFLPAGYNSLVVWKLCSANNAVFNSSRTYLAWVAYNPVDFLVFLGLPVAVFFLRGVIGAIRNRTQDAPWRFVMALLVTIIVLDLTGMNRGEVARLWMILMPMAVAVAAHEMRETGEQRNWEFLGCFALLFVQSVLFKLSFDLLLPAVK